MRPGRIALAMVMMLLLAALALPSLARADAYLRVLTQRAKIHTGPGGGYRTIFVAERGNVLKVLERGTRGYWFKVELDDGTSGWVFGEQVTPFEVGDDDPGLFTRMGRAIRKAILGPSPVPYSDVELSFSSGLLGGLGAGEREQVFLFRPAWLLDRYFAIEGWFGLSPRKQESLFIGGLGWTMRLAPGDSFGPYAHGGVGVGRFEPKEDAFVLQPKTLMAISIGGGFELTFKKRITLRVDFRNWTFFDENEAANAQEYSGGLAIFF